MDSLAWRWLDLDESLVFLQLDALDLERETIILYFRERWEGN